MGLDLKMQVINKEGGLKIVDFGGHLGFEPLKEKNGPLFFPPLVTLDPREQESSIIFAFNKKMTRLVSF